MSTYPEVVKAILTNTTLTEDEKSILISKMMEEFQENYPELHNHATKNDVKEVDLKIEEIRKDINELKVELQKVRNDGKNIELKLTKEIEKVKLDLTKEIEKVKLDLTKEIEKVKLDLTKDIKELDLKLTKEIEKVKLDLTKDIKELDVKISNTKVEIIKWVAGMMIGQTFIIAGIVAGIFKFFVH